MAARPRAGRRARPDHSHQGLWRARQLGANGLVYRGALCGWRRPGDIRHSTADVSKIREVLGYVPEISLLEGLRQTVEWYRVK